MAQQFINLINLSAVGVHQRGKSNNKSSIIYISNELYEVK